MTDQSKSWRLRLWDIPGIDAEQDDCDSEDAEPDECKLQPAVMATEKPWHRRHAIQLAAKLPESKSDAPLILQAACPAC